MPTIKLYSAVDLHDGSVGLILDGMKLRKTFRVVCTDSVEVAHDLIDHQNGIENIGSIGDELEAIGAEYYRGATQYVKGAIQLLFDMHTEGVGFKWPVPDGTVFCPLRDRMEFDIYAATPEVLWKAEIPTIAKEFRKAALQYMCAGYAKAANRWESSDHADAAFKVIIAATKPLFTNLDRLKAGKHVFEITL